jgi:demethylmenaquinone methyltransferase/2-methoxy-6-polyprenyl-1,4-benzoquinol methylase
MSVTSKYNRIAPIYELTDLPFELLFFRRWRKEALSNLSGRVLEVGIGTGRNLKYYPASCSVTGIDFSERMLEKASHKAREMKNVTLLLMNAENLEFPDNSFDYIVVTFVLCSIPDPLRALKEMRRVLRPSGEMIAIEYVRSSNHFVAWFEDLINPAICSLVGDNMNRKTIENINKAGFTIKQTKNLICENSFKEIRARP